MGYCLVRAKKVAEDLYAEAVAFCERYDISFACIRVSVLPCGYRIAPDPEGISAVVFEFDGSSWSYQIANVTPATLPVGLTQLVRAWVEVDEAPTGVPSTPTLSGVSVEVSAVMVTPKGVEPIVSYPRSNEEYAALLKSLFGSMFAGIELASFPLQIHNHSLGTTIMVASVTNLLAPYFSIKAGESFSSPDFSLSEHKICLYRRLDESPARISMEIRSRTGGGRLSYSRFEARHIEI